MNWAMTTQKKAAPLRVRIHPDVAFVLPWKENKMQIPLKGKKRINKNNGNDIKILSRISSGGPFLYGSFAAGSLVGPATNLNSGNF